MPTLIAIFKINKYVNHKNFFAPYSVKKHVLEACINSSLTYGCEAWSYGNISSINTLHRKSIKMILGIRQTVPNHIIHIESGVSPIETSIKAQQLKYWLSIKNYGHDNPTSPVAKMLNIAKQHDIHFIRHYKLLENKFRTPANCRHTLNKEFLEYTKRTITSKADPDSALGTYFSLNPQLEAILHNTHIIESERILLTKYKMGSHNLKIETGRWARIDRDKRLCNKCNLNAIQTLSHVLYDCQFTTKHHYNGPISEFFISENCIETLTFINNFFTK